MRHKIWTERRRATAAGVGHRRVTVERVFIVEDHELVRNLLGKLIEQTPDLALNGSAGTAEEALEQISRSLPQIVLIDVSLPGMDGIELIGIISERWPDMRTLAVSGHDEALYAKAALRAGARGYVMKGQVLQIAEAIRTVRSGEIYLSEEMRQELDG